jgi:hypothetical protein
VKTRTVRVPPDVHAAVREIAAESGVPMGGVLRQAVEVCATERFFDQADGAYARLQADPAAWAEELEERGLLENTLMDGLEDEPVAAGGHRAVDE